MYVLAISPHAPGLGRMPAAEALRGIPTVSGGATAVGQSSAPNSTGNSPPVVGSGAAASTTPTWGSLLGSIMASGVGGTSSSAAPGAAVGIHVGEGRPPVPRKLADKIWRWEFVDMAELLPEFWSQGRDEEYSSRQPARRTRKVTDIFTWVQCFTAYVGVVATRYPETVAELMGYLMVIIQASQDYEGQAWARYDEAFRRRAAIDGDRCWSKLNTTIYTMCFTGKAKSSVARCEFCLATTHTSADCAQSGDRDPDVRARLKAIETAILALVSGAEPKFRTSLKTSRPKSGEICNLWNGNQCSYGADCHHMHICLECKGDHPALYCPLRSSLHPARGPYVRGSRGVGQPGTRGSGSRRGYRARDMSNPY